MNELFVTAIIVALVCWFLYWLAEKFKEPTQTGLQIVALGGGFLWLLFHAREIIHTIASL